DALLLAAAHVARIAAQLVGEPDGLQCTFGFRHGLGVAHAPHVERQADILEGRQRREEIVGLENEADVTAPQIGELLGRQPVDGLVLDTYRTRGRRQDAAEDRQQGRLAAAGRAHQQRQLAGPQGQADALERPHAGRALAQLLDDVARLENDGVTHLLNTMAGSIFVTFMIADTAEIAHMKSVSRNSETASPGVIMMGSAVCVLSTTTTSAMIIPST